MINNKKSVRCLFLVGFVVGFFVWNFGVSHVHAATVIVEQLNHSTEQGDTGFFQKLGQLTGSAMPTSVDLAIQQGGNISANLAWGCPADYSQGTNPTLCGGYAPIINPVGSGGIPQNFLIGPPTGNAWDGNNVVLMLTGGLSIMGSTDPGSYPQIGGGNFCLHFYGFNCGSSNVKNMYFVLYSGSIIGVDPATLRQLKQDGTTSISEGGTITGGVIFGGTLPPSADPMQLQVQVQPFGTPFTNSPTIISVSGASGQFVSTSITNLANGRYHWEARVIDTTTNAVVGPWQEFGTAGNTDFIITTAVIQPGSLQQDKSDGTTPITGGGLITDSTVVLKGTLQSASLPSGDQLELQTEVKPVGVGFTNVPTQTSAPVAPGQTASLTASNLFDSEYHWQARVVDTATNQFVSDWQSFGTPSGADFIVRTVPIPPGVITQQTDGSLFVGATFASQVFKATSNAVLASIEVFPSDFSTGSRNPDTNGCGLALWNDDTNTFVANADNGFSGYGCGGGDLTFSFASTMPHLQAGVHYRWQWSLSGPAGVRFHGSQGNLVDGLFSPGGTMLNAEFVAYGGPEQANVAPNTLHQYQSDGTTSAPEGGIISDRAVFGGTLPASADPIQMQVDVEPFGTAFSNTPTASSASGATGQLASIPLNLANGPYHWQVRVFDTVTHVTSAWQEFGTAGNVDFTLAKGLVATSNLILADTSTNYSGGAGFNPIFSPTPLSPDKVYYHAPASFVLSQLQVDHVDNSSNNHDGVGQIQAWIYDLNGNPIAGSTNTMYAESSCSACAFVFNNVNVPQDFRFGFIVDSIQGFGGFGINNLRFVESPTDFWAAINNTSLTTQLRQTPGSSNKPANDLLKEFPNGWVVHVLKTTDVSNQSVDMDGFRWYQVQDATDGTSGWMPGKNLSTNTDILSPSGSQSNASIEPSTSFANDVRAAIDNYYSNTNTTPSLYSSNDNTLLASVFNNSTGGLTKELALAVAAVESGPGFNNEIVAKDYGYGVMQLQLKAQKIGIKNLQILLNQYPATRLASTGPGSPGNETTNFGDLTVNAVGKFQQINGLPSTGIVATSTILALNALLPPNPTISGIDSTFRFKEQLRKGDTEHGFDHRGIGSGIGTIPCSDFKNAASNNYFGNCHANPTDTSVQHPYVTNPAYSALFKYYGNTRQSIFANVKDGLTILKQKYDLSLCALTSGLTAENVFFSATDLHNICAVWGYNGFPEKVPNYLGAIADRLSNLTTAYFPGYTPTTDLALLSQKVQIANRHKQVVKLGSPGELSVKDSQGRVTGVVNGQIVTNIPDSLYDPDSEAVMLLFPSDTFTYQVIGTEAGTYSLTIHSDNGAASTEFDATGIQTASNTVHDYSVNFDILAAGGNGVTLSIDQNGDGIIDRTITTGATLTDITPPVVSTPLLNSQYTLNATATIQFSATDDKSGVASVTSTLNGVAVTNGQTIVLAQPGVNTFVITAVDNAGNIATSSQSFSVMYDFGGFLAPVKSDGAGLYKQGRTLPVKFQLTDANGQFVSTSIAHLYQAKIQDSVVGTDEISIPTGNNDAGNQFRYDAQSNQYVFNLDTGLLSPGTWQLKTVLDDGANYTVLISIKP